MRPDIEKGFSTTGQKEKGLGPSSGYLRTLQLSPFRILGGMSLSITRHEGMKERKAPEGNLKGTNVRFSFVSQGHRHFTDVSHFILTPILLDSYITSVLQLSKPRHRDRPEGHMARKAEPRF